MLHNLVLCVLLDVLYLDLKNNNNNLDVAVDITYKTGESYVLWLVP